MGEGDLKELRELVEFLKASDVAEFDMERPELKVRLKFEGKAQPPAMPAPALDLSQLARLATPAAPAAAADAPLAAPLAAVESPALAAAAPAEEAGLHIVKSPLVGTFYDAPSPGAELFARMGDQVAAGRVLCIVEAMKIMNEIESDGAGEIVKVFVKTGQPVEYGQPLFGLRA